MDSWLKQAEYPKSVPRVLVVEDDRFWRASICSILENNGFLVTRSSGYKGAVRELRRGRFDMVVLDLLLASGAGLSEGLQLARVTTSYGIPTLIISAYTDKKETEQALSDIRVDHCISKNDFTAKELLDATEKLLRKSVHPGPSRCFRTGGKCAFPELKEEDRSIFVGMPFGDTENNVYRFGIKPALRRLQCSYRRADEVKLDIEIMCKICQLIQKAQLVVMDISAWNANVLYELGIAHALGKRAILLVRESTNPPADLAGLEYLRYSDFSKLSHDLTARLIQAHGFKRK